MLLRIGTHGFAEKGDRRLDHPLLDEQHAQFMIGYRMVGVGRQHLPEQTLRILQPSSFPMLQGAVGLSVALFEVPK